jgi:hypothetical protein
MNNYFQKINLNLEEANQELIKGEFFEAYGPTFNSYYIKDNEYFNNLINSKICFGIQPDWVNYTEIIDYGAHPHVDHSLTVLNYYFEANDFTTIFWKLKHQVETVPVYQTRKDGKLTENRTSSFNMTDISPVTSFKAKSNEAYLINIREIHSANRLKKGSPRTMIRWLWENESFENVLESIKILNPQ